MYILPDGSINTYVNGAWQKLGITATDLANKVDKNASIVGATKTKITYDAKGLVVAGEDITILDAPGTKAQFNTALTDGDFLFAGDLPPLVAVTDLPNGTVAINSGYGTENAIRPINELPLLTGNIDNTSDKLVLYDASTDSHVYVTPAIVNAPEIFRNNGALTGVAPPPFKVGIDYSTGTQYYVNASGNWTAFPPGTTVVLTDLPNGTISINAGLGGSETAIRPITEQDTLVGVIDEVNDFTTIYDASTQKHVKTPLSALVKDLYRDRGMPNTLMTLSGVATLSPTDFLKWTSNFFILGGGRGAGTLSISGFYQISMPPVGTVIQGLGGAAGITVTIDGINMRNPFGGGWSVLYYILNPGGANFNSANFRLAGYNNDFIVPDNWVMIAAYNPDISTVKIGNGQILGRGYNTNVGLELYRDRGMPNTLMTLSGIASLDSTAFLKWTNKFTIRSGGKGIGTISTSGFYDIVMPPVGTTIQGAGGANSNIVTTAGFQMNNGFSTWSTLYYILPIGGSASNNANFRTVGFGSDFVIPDNWVVVAVYNADRNNVKLGNGQILEAGSTSASATVSPATVVPLANNNGTTPSGAVGTSVLYARQDHVHPRPVRLTPPATPVIVALKVSSTSEQVIYDMLVICTQTASIGWNTLSAPNIAGFQTANILVQGTERAASGTLTQIMGHECAKWADNKVYMNVETRTEPYAYNVFLQLTYNLN
jgi:hypothetical protein